MIRPGQATIPYKASGSPHLASYFHIRSAVTDRVYTGSSLECESASLFGCATYPCYALCSWAQTWSHLLPPSLPLPLLVLQLYLPHLNFSTFPVLISLSLYSTFPRISFFPSSFFSDAPLSSVCSPYFHQTHKHKHTSLLSSLGGVLAEAHIHVRGQRHSMLRWLLTLSS